MVSGTFVAQSRSKTIWPLRELSEIQLTEESLKEMKGARLETGNEQSVLFTKSETEPTTNLAEIINPENYSNIHHLYNVTGYVLRFVNNLKKKVKNEKGNITVDENLSVEEISNVERSWLIETQKTFKSDEKHFVELVLQFGLFADKDGLIRCKGRLARSNLSFEF